MFISKLFIYPIKSCAGVEVSTLEFDHSGPVGDRRFVIVNNDGDFLTQRELPKMAKIQPNLSSQYLRLSLLNDEKKASDAPVLSVDIRLRGKLSRVRVWRDEVLGHDCGDEAARWLSSVLGCECRLMQLPENNTRRADPDYAPDNVGVSYADGFPLLIVSQSSLDALSAQAGIEVDVRRFRPNIVIADAGEAYSELRWHTLGLDDHAVSSDVLRMVKPCERCIIPTRHPDTLERSADVMQALKDQCRINGRMIFGQNAVYDGTALTQGDIVSVMAWQSE